MKATFRFFFSCLLCLTLPLASGYGNEGGATLPANPAEQERKAGERMVLTINGVEYVFRWCPPGAFMMGSPVREFASRDNTPQHRVTLTQGFWMLETQVTQAMWKSIMDNNPSHFRGEKLPVETVSWNDSMEYIKKLNELGIAPAGFKFSLPTEAQWEYACRAGTTTAFHFGDTLSRAQANFGDDHESKDRTTEVYSYPANAWGLYDMHGNVLEWCLDNIRDYTNDAVTDPIGPDHATNRAARGGSWSSARMQCSSSYRTASGPAEGLTYRYYIFGIRLVLVSSE